MTDYRDLQNRIRRLERSSDPTGGDGDAWGAVMRHSARLTLLWDARVQPAEDALALEFGDLTPEQLAATRRERAAKVREARRLLGRDTLARWRADHEAIVGWYASCGHDPARLLAFGATPEAMLDHVCALAWPDLAPGPGETPNIAA